MISNFLILIILIYLAIRLLELILLILRRLNRSQSLTQNKLPRILAGILFPAVELPSRQNVVKFAKLD